MCDYEFDRPGCLFPGECCMSADHFISECHTAEMMEAASFAASINEMDKCPKCGSDEIERDEVDVGVGVITGPWGCLECGWSENLEYDFSDGRSRETERGTLDPLGGLTPHPKR